MALVVKAILYVDLITAKGNIFRPKKICCAHLN